MDGTPVLTLWYSSTHPMVLEYSLDVSGILSIRGKTFIVYFFKISWCAEPFGSTSEGEFIIIIINALPTLN